MDPSISIDGVALPKPLRDGIVITDEKVWSSDTGRTATGKMSGTLVAVKTTVAVTWGRLTLAQAQMIRALVSDKSKGFHTLTYRTTTGQTDTITCYFDNPAFTIHALTGPGWVSGLAVTAIEQ